MLVSKFLEEKWRKGFRFFDVDKDGYYTRRDFELITEYLSDRTGQTGEEERKKTTREWVKWIDILLPLTSSGTLDEHGFIEAISELYKDAENFRVQVIETYSRRFDALDMNKDGLISYEELKIYYESHRVTDDLFIRRVFEKLDTNKDGYVERDELITAGVNYWCSSVESDGCAFQYDPPK